MTQKVTDYKRHILDKAADLEVKRAELEEQGLDESQIRHSLSITADGLSPYGSPGFLEPCGDDYFSMIFGGSYLFADVLGMTGSTINKRVFNYIAWVADETYVTSGGVTPAVVGLANECEPRPQARHKTCQATFEGYKHLGASGGTESIFNNIQNCETLRRESPRFRLDGTVIDSNEEYRAALAFELVMKQFKMWVNGKNTAGATLPSVDDIIQTGYMSGGTACPAMDSIVVDWQNAACFSDASPATWTDGRGARNLPANTHIAKVIEGIVRMITHRISLAPQLDSQPLQPGDIFIKGPRVLLDALVECMVCYHTCGAGALTNAEIVTATNSKEAREYREELMLGGLWGYGSLRINGLTIPLLPDDEGPDSLYVITRKVGSRPIFYFENLDLNRAIYDNPYNAVDITDNGKFYHYVVMDETCRRYNVDMLVRMICEAPFLQARIDNFAGTVIQGDYSFDVLSPNFINGAIV